MMSSTEFWTIQEIGKKNEHDSNNIDNTNSAISSEDSSTRLNTAKTDKDKKNLLNSSENDCYGQLFSTTLMCMKSALSLISIQDSSKHLEETLKYFKSTFNVDQIKTIHCTQEFLLNLDQLASVSSSSAQTKSSNNNDWTTDDLSICFTSHINYKQRYEIFIQLKTDLKKYVNTNENDIQAALLDLLVQLLLIRVDYSLLDGDEHFLAQIISQLEIIEQTIAVSGHEPETHALSALKTIVYNLFLVRHKTEHKELEAQRIFIVQTLIKLVRYNKVM
ncbi:unnamed protein product [Rotaria magnacalcarata]|uniref:Uncharacterized protein n=1 Tax=Rotaria magnacalcarata TaxID=392030 RepID=A0A819V0V4_9BILA|nr:unnamed protein product [Rotaria magnacalcarata]